MITDQELIIDADYWLLHTEIHWQTTSYQFEFVAKISRYWKENRKISLKQRRYVIYILNKHTR